MVLISIDWEVIMPNEESIRDMALQINEELSDEYDSLIKQILGIELSSSNREEGEASRQNRIKALIQQFSTES